MGTVSADFTNECEALFKSVKLELEDHVERSCQPLRRFILKQQLKVQDLEGRLLVKTPRPDTSPADVNRDQKWEQLEERIKHYEIQLEALSHNFKSLIQVLANRNLMSH